MAELTNLEGLELDILVISPLYIPSSLLSYLP